jgi:HK97 family phage portal protein
VSIIRRVLLGSPEERVLGGLGLNPQAFDRVPFFGAPRVDEKSVLGLAAAWSCVSLLSDVVSTLPVDAYYRDNGQRRPYRPSGAKPVWLLTPSVGDPSLSIQNVLSQITVSLYLNGNAFVYAPKDPDTLEPLEIRVLNPNAVSIERRNGRVVYTVQTNAKLDKLEFGPEAILHIPLIQMPGAERGINPLESLRRTLGLGLTLDESASSFFANASTPSGIIETPNVLTKEQMTNLKSSWDAAHTGGNAHKVGVLQGGASWKALSFRPEDAQLLASREFGVAEVARIFRVPPALLAMTTPGAMSFASVSELNSMFVSYTLRPLVEKIERALSTLIPLPEAFVKLSLDALVRGNLRERYEAHRIGLSAGFETVAEVRRIEDMTPVEDPGAGNLRLPLNEADALITSTRQKADIYAALVGAGMDPGEARRISGL